MSDDRSLASCGLLHTFDDDERAGYVESLATVTAPDAVLHLLCVNDMTRGDGGPRRISQSELRASFSVGWKIASIDADRLGTNFDAGGIPAWLARIEKYGDLADVGERPAP